LNLAVSGRFVAYAVLGPGDFFGELAAIDGQPRSATVAAESASRVAILPAREFRQLATSNQDVALSLLRRLTDIIRTCDDRIFDLSSLGAKQRIYFELLRLAEPDPSGSGSWVIFPLPTQTALAASADTTRQTVARVIGRLSEDALVTRKPKALYIHDRKRLESLILQVKGEM
jgi:CRP-like cAMP-binding protein